MFPGFNAHFRCIINRGTVGVKLLEVLWRFAEVAVFQQISKNYIN